MKFTCSKLTENICGDYFVSLQMNKKEADFVCYEHEIHIVSVDFYQEVDLAISYRKKANFSVECYLMCSLSSMEDVTVSNTSTVDPNTVLNWVLLLESDI